MAVLPVLNVNSVRHIAFLVRIADSHLTNFSHLGRPNVLVYVDAIDSVYQSWPDQ